MDKMQAAASACRAMVVMAAEEGAKNITMPYHGSFGENIGHGAEKILKSKYGVDAHIAVATDCARRPVSCAISFGGKGDKASGFRFTEEESGRIYRAAWARPCQGNLQGTK